MQCGMVCECEMQMSPWWSMLLCAVVTATTIYQHQHGRRMDDEHCYSVCYHQHRYRLHQHEWGLCVVILVDAIIDGKHCYVNW